MKKGAAFILLLIYFTVSTGFVVSVHYCMNKVDRVELGDGHKDQCGKCGMYLNKSHGCCKDDVKLIKMKVDQSAAKTTVADFSFYLPVIVVNPFLLSLIRTNLQAGYPVAHGPPLNELPLYLQNCVFRI